MLPVLIHLAYMAFSEQMAGNYTAGEPAGDDVPLLLDLAFDSGTLAVVRAETRAHAGQAGLSENRAAEVVLAVHELAANVTCHGGGKGRLRVWNLAGALRCQVDDGDLIASEDPAARPNMLPEMPGHGLWVVRRIADRIQTLSGPRGTRVTLTFVLPRPE